MVYPYSADAWPIVIGHKFHLWESGYLIGFTMTDLTDFTTFIPSFFYHHWLGTWEVCHWLCIATQDPEIKFGKSHILLMITSKITLHSGDSDSSIPKTLCNSNISPWKFWNFQKKKMYGICIYIYHQKQPKCRKIYHTWMVRGISSPHQLDRVLQVCDPFLRHGKRYQTKKKKKTGTTNQRDESKQGT